MGLTLVAILTAALLLPGIIAARGFYLAGQTREVDVPVPSLSTPEGISLVGAFSIAVHMLYVTGLMLVSRIPPLLPLPLANPYALFAEPHGLAPLDIAFALFGGLLLLSGLAFLLGLVTGQFVRRSYFYGPLAEVIESADGDDKGILAYVVSKIEKEGALIGYRGTVDALFRDGDRFPTKVVLKAVVPFYLELGEDGPRRVESDQLIDWLVLRADDWHNIAFRVFRYATDAEESALSESDVSPRP